MFPKTAVSRYWATMTPSSILPGFIRCRERIRICRLLLNKLQCLWLPISMAGCAPTTIALDLLRLSRGEPSYTHTHKSGNKPIGCHLQIEFWAGWYWARSCSPAVAVRPTGARCWLVLESTSSAGTSSLKSTDDVAPACPQKLILALT